MSAKIHAYIFVLYTTNFNVSRYPLCANQAGRVRYALRGSSTLTFSFYKSFVDSRIYLLCWIYVNFFIRKLCETIYLFYTKMRVMMTVIPRVTSFLCGRDFYLCASHVQASILCISNQRSISFLICTYIFFIQIFY